MIATISKERQLDIMVPPGQSMWYHKWSGLAKKKIEPKPDQVYRSNYQFMVWDKKLEECLNNNVDWEKLEDKWPRFANKYQLWWEKDKSWIWIFTIQFFLFTYMFEISHNDKRFKRRWKDVF